MIDTSHEPDDIIGGLRIPIVFTYRDAGGDTMSFFCKFCGRRHTHGRYPEVGKANGHAVAHCQADDSPYRITGYELRELDYELPEPQKKYRVRYTRDGRMVSGLLAAIRRAGATR
jgi:hypothetical protein